MPRIFELFGYPIINNSTEAQHHRQTAHCPFMNAPCDGGGNRYLSMIQLKYAEPSLQTFFDGLSSVHAGVCSIQVTPNTSPWIVCPRRLLYLGSSTQHQETLHQHLLQLSKLPLDMPIGVWPEVKIVYHTSDDVGSFDYTFDYILMPLATLPIKSIEDSLEVEWSTIASSVKKAGYQLKEQSGTIFVEYVPFGNPVIIEIMTSSTSGGNTNKRTTIPLAFQDAILGRTHQAPSINKRQVWARMISQLIAKSEVALAWNGYTIWVLQNTLVDYISATTALDVHRFASNEVGEVTLVAYGYTPQDIHQDNLIELTQGDVYAGPIGGGTGEPSFQDITRTRVLPPKAILLHKLLQHRPTQIIYNGKML